MNAGKKRGLGRGLSALFGDTAPKEKSSVSNLNNMAAISDLTRNPYQPRQNFSETKLEELANSIKKNGIIQPIAVRPKKSENGKFEIVAGERRWLAAQRAGLHEIPVTVLDLSDVESLEVAIVENIQRDDLNPIEEAKGYKRLNEEFNYDHENIKLFYHKESEAPKKPIRLYLWHEAKDFVVIMQKLGRSQVFLVTCFYLDREGKRKDFNTRYQNYLDKIDPTLRGCEWF